MLGDVKVGDIVRLIPSKGRPIDDMTETWIVDAKMPDDMLQIAKVHSSSPHLRSVTIDEIDVPHLTVSPDV